MPLRLLTYNPKLNVDFHDILAWYKMRLDLVEKNLDRVENVRVDGLEQTLTAGDLLDVGLYTIRGKICCLYCHWTTSSDRGLIYDPRKRHARDASDCPIVWSLVAGERIPLIYHVYPEFFSGKRLSQHPEGRPFTEWWPSLES